MKIVTLLMAACAMLAGCATPKAPLNTASGNPEVIISGVTKKQVADYIVDRLTAKGLTIRTVNDYEVVAGKRMNENFMTQALFGSRYDSVPEARISYTLTNQPSGVKVYGRAEIVTNPGSAFERVQDVTRANNVEIQNMLDELRSKLDAPATVPKPPISASPMATQSAPIGVPTKVGRDQYQAEQFVKAHACMLPVTAGPAGPGFEIYSAACSNGDTLMIRCEFGNCRALK